MAKDSGRGGARPGATDARQDRLKLALRENLKRRKAQARERGKGQVQDQSNVTEPSSTDHETSLHGEVGERDE